MLFVDNIVLVAETKEEVNRKLEKCRVIQENTGLLICRKKTEFV